MKLVVAILLALALTAHAGEYRTWKITKGGSFTAQYVETRGTAIVLQRMNGQTNVVAAKDLSKRDREHLEAESLRGRLRYGKPDATQQPPIDLARYYPNPYQGESAGERNKRWALQNRLARLGIYSPSECCHDDAGWSNSGMDGCGGDSMFENVPSW